MGLHGQRTRATSNASDHPAFSFWGVLSGRADPLIHLSQSTTIMCPCYIAMGVAHGRALDSAASKSRNPCFYRAGMGTAERPAKLDNKGQQNGNISVEKAAMGAVDVEAKVTVYVVLACAIAASGGVLFGYDGKDTPFSFTASNGLLYIGCCCLLSGYDAEAIAVHCAARCGPYILESSPPLSRHTSTHSSCLQGASLGVLKACNSLLKCGESTVQRGRRMHACWHAHRKAPSLQLYSVLSLCMTAFMSAHLISSSAWVTVLYTWDDRQKGAVNKRNSGPCRSLTATVMQVPRHSGGARERLLLQIQRQEAAGLQRSHALHWRAVLPARRLCHAALWAHGIHARCWLSLHPGFNPAGACSQATFPACKVNKSTGTFKCA